MRKCKSRKIYRIFQVISGLQYAQGLDLFTENTGKKRYTYTKAKKRERYTEKGHAEITRRRERDILYRGDIITIHLLSRALSYYARRLRLYTPRYYNMLKNKSS